MLNKRSNNDDDDDDKNNNNDTLRKKYLTHTKKIKHTRILTPNFFYCNQV